MLTLNNIKCISLSFLKYNHNFSQFQLIANNGNSRQIRLLTAPNCSGSTKNSSRRNCTIKNKLSGDSICSKRLDHFGSESLPTSLISVDYSKRLYSSVIVSTTVQGTKKKKMPKLNEQERNEQLQPLLKSGWTIVKDRDAIYKEYLFKNFNQAFAFMTSVALLAEKMDHHPEWFNVYNKIQVTMSTHDVGGLSAKDIKVANFMEEIVKRYI